MKIQREKAYTNTDQPHQPPNRWERWQSEARVYAGRKTLSASCGDSSPRAEGEPRGCPLLGGRRRRVGRVAFFQKLC